MKKVFIVILNWNRPKLTIECLESLARLEKDKFSLHTIVVDNASEDDSLKRLSKYIDNESSGSFLIDLIRNKKNLGFAQGNNVGMRYALKKGADYIMLLNNDTNVDKNLIMELIKSAQKHPHTGAFSPKIYFAKGFEFHKKRYKKKDLGKVIWSAGGEIDWDNVYATNKGVDEVDRGQFNSAKEIEFATGACLFLRCKALKEIGLFDPRYFMYFEDVDLSVRLKKERWRIRYIPDAILWHKVAQSSAIGSDLNDYFITRNRLLFGLTYARFRTKTALVKESIKFLVSGRKWQKIGVKDYYIKNFGKGSWKQK